MMAFRSFRISSCLILSLAGAAPLWAGEASRPTDDWHYGGMVDLSYPLNFNFPENHKWRYTVTTPRTNELAPNMALAYVRKNASLDSRWGMELGVQAGYDTNALVPEPIPGRDKPIDGADTLRHISRANVSYLAPIGNGLTVTAGLFKSHIGYQSFYAKDNLHYTRTYVNDYAPYFMFGLAAQYPINERAQLGVYVINGYNYLSHPNDQPSYGSQLVWKPGTRWTVTQNLYYGPDQSTTDLRFWRLFSDSIVEWKDDRLTLGAAYDIGTETAAELPGRPRTFWTGGALYARWNVSGPWSVAARPGFYWDRNGRMTGGEQFLKAFTTTVEYRLPAGRHSLIARLEHRYDESTGAGGGFFKGKETAPGVIGLAPEQHLLLLSVIWAFDS
jgi:hypothetical protein